MVEVTVVDDMETKRRKSQRINEFGVGPGGKPQLLWPLWLSRINGIKWCDGERWTGRMVVPDASVGEQGIVVV